MAALNVKNTRKKESCIENNDQLVTMSSGACSNVTNLCEQNLHYISGIRVCTIQLPVTCYPKSTLLNDSVDELGIYLNADLFSH